MNSILLLGGDGFLGKGLLNELMHRSIHFQSIDKDIIDLSVEGNIPKIINILEGFDKIVILASKIGSRLFETNAIEAAKYNDIIHHIVFNSIQYASKLYNKSYDVTYYSTSEVFDTLKSSDIIINDDTKYAFNYSNTRHLYAYNKWKAELDYFNLQKINPNILNAVKIIRPFNIFGRNQKRGVVYEMIKTALFYKKIFYSDDTTRTLTDIDYASKMSVDAILSTSNKKVNIADSRNSLTMLALAEIVRSVLKIDCELVKTEPDKSIRYRNTSLVDLNVILSESIMKKHILELASQIKALI